MEDVEVFLGPFSCIAGRNGVGKSNLFDALLFLRESVDKPLLEAAMQIRGGEVSLRGLFSPGADQMFFEVDFFVSPEGVDDFGREAHASATFLRYQLGLSYTAAEGGTLRDNLRVLSEDLSYIPRHEANGLLRFAYEKEWLDSCLVTGRRSAYLTTLPDLGVIRLHQDRTVERKGGGRPWEFPLANLQRTALSSVTNAQESPTLVLARQALRRCTLLQLEPTALREPDSFQDGAFISSRGRHLPATLNRIALHGGQETVYTRVANRLSELVDEVDSVRVDANQERRQYTVYLKDQKGNELPAGSLSDGTLRFLALSVLELDPTRAGVLCLEEPENGIHPERLVAMLTLLEGIAVDATMALDDSNPLQQVLINTHSPIVIELMNADSVLFAKVGPTGLSYRRIGRTDKKGQLPPNTVTLGEVLSYLQPLKTNPGASSRHDSVRDLFEQLELF